MMLMLGTRVRPELLVVVEQERGLSDFDFRVVNGAWNGTFFNGHITVWDPPSGSYTTMDKMEILTDNQDRLRHKVGEWREAFYNFDNENYVAPLPKPVVYPSIWDDDIPF